MIFFLSFLFHIKEICLFLAIFPLGSTVSSFFSFQKVFNIQIVKKYMPFAYVSFVAHIHNLFTSFSVLVYQNRKQNSVQLICINAKWIQCKSATRVYSTHHTLCPVSIEILLLKLSKLTWNVQTNGNSVTLSNVFKSVFRKTNNWVFIWNNHFLLSPIEWIMIVYIYFCSSNIEQSMWVKCVCVCVTILIFVFSVTFYTFRVYISFIFLLVQSESIERILNIVS